MAVTVLPRNIVQHYNPQQFEPQKESFGTSLGKGLSNLINHKVEALQKQKGIEKTAEWLESVGMPKEFAKIKETDPQLFEHFVKNFEYAPDDEKDDIRQEANEIQKKYWSSPEEEAEEDSELAPIPYARTEEGQQSYNSTIPGMNGLMGNMNQEPEMANYDEVQSFPEEGYGLSGQSARTPGFTTKSGVRITPKGSAEAARKEQASLRKEENERRSEGFKETKKDREALLESYQVAKRDLDDLQRFKELENEGKLDTAGYLEFLERSGLDIPALMNEGSEEFNKIAANFIRDAKTYYGGRVTNQEMEQFLKTIPSLSQSPEGRKRVIANMERLKKAAVIRYQISRQITKENGGIPPLDLAEQVEDRSEKRILQLSHAFKQDLKRKVPEGQNKLITALQAGLGSAIGNLSIKGAAKGAIKGAGAGAAIGALGGPIGATGGAVLGGIGGLTGLV